MWSECDGDDPLSYRHLDGDWALFYKIARHFVHKVYKQDRADFLHDLLMEMAKVSTKYRAWGKPLTEAGLMRVASYELSAYWSKQRKLTTGLDCGHCSTERRRRCQDEDLYSQCPKLVKLVSLNERIDAGDGHSTELWEVLADDTALDIDAWVDAKMFLQNCPRSLVRIAYKRYSGRPLNYSERALLSYYRRKLLAIEQKKRCRQQERLRINAEQVERIRQFYFSDSKGINQIARELHHDKRTVQKSIAIAPRLVS